MTNSTAQSTPPIPEPRSSTTMDLVYGKTGTKKTTQARSFINYIQDRWPGSITRILSAEQASSETIFADAIDAGIAEVYWMHDKSQPRSLLQHILAGDWPTPTWTGEKWVYRNLPTPPEKWPKIKAYIVEGTQSICELMMKCLIAEGRKISQDVVALYVEDGIKLGTGSPSHYGQIQRDFLAGFMAAAPSSLNFASGGSVWKILMLGHETKGEDNDGAKSPIYGPAFVGKAATSQAGQKVGNMIHMDDFLETREVVDPATKIKSIQQEVVTRAYFNKHPDANNPSVLWEAKLRIPPQRWAKAAIAKAWPGGYFVPTLLDEPDGVRMGLREFYHYLDRIQDHAAKLAVQARESTGGVDSEKSDNGIASSPAGAKE